MKKLSITFVLILTAISVFAIGIGAWSEESKTTKSIKQLDDGVFFMEFEGDYRLDEYLANGGGKSVDDLRNFITKSLKKGTWTCPKI